jgi:predicted nuclease of predicted toxin-antitoxin system
LTALRFLIDENLSVKLPEVAHRRGFEATHVIHLGLGDWNILEIVESHGWVLVTNNAVEFRSRYRMIGIRPGVIFLHLAYQTVASRSRCYPLTRRLEDPPC